MNSFAQRLAVLAVAAAIGASQAARAANQIVCWKAQASQPCIRTFVGDTEAGLPSVGVPEGFPAWAKDTDRLVCYYDSAWQPCNEGGGTGGDPTLAGDVDGSGSANDLDEAAVEAELETVLDLGDLQGAVTDAQVPDGITVTLAASATSATTATTATTANAGDSATAFFPSGTFEDALVDGSLEADEVNPTLGSQTQGNYVAGATASQGLLLTGTEGASLGLIDCAASEALVRNAGDTAWECATVGGGSGLTHPQIMARLAVGGGY